MKKKKVKKKEKKSVISGIMKRFEMEIMSDKSPSQTPYVIPFKHMGLQYITGGIPGGRMTEIIGNSQSGKSYLLYEAIERVLSMGGKAFLNDPETSYEPAYGTSIGIKGDKSFFYSKQSVLEDFFTAAKEYILYVRSIDKTCPIVIGLDSYPALIHQAAKKDLAGMGVDDEIKGYLDAKKNALLKIMLGDFIPFIGKHKATLIIVNQGKMKIGMTQYQDPRTSNADGTMKFYATLRLWGDWRKEKDVSKKKRIGMVSTWETWKNRNIPPGLKTQVTILNKSGLVPDSGFGDLLDGEGRVKKYPKKPKKPRLYGYKGKKYKIENLIRKFPELHAHPGWGE